MEEFNTDLVDFVPLVKAMLDKGLWPVVVSNNKFCINFTLVDGEETQVITFDNPAMYISQITQEEGVPNPHFVLYLPVSDDQQIVLHDPTLKTASTVHDAPVAVYIDQYMT